MVAFLFVMLLSSMFIVGCTKSESPAQPNSGDAEAELYEVSSTNNPGEKEKKPEDTTIEVGVTDTALGSGVEITIDSMIVRPTVTVLNITISNNRDEDIRIFSPEFLFLVDPVAKKSYRAPSLDNIEALRNIPSGTVENITIYFEPLATGVEKLEFRGDLFCMAPVFDDSFNIKFEFEPIVRQQELGFTDYFLNLSQGVQNDFYQSLNEQERADLENLLAGKNLQTSTQQEIIERFNQWVISESIKSVTPFDQGGYVQGPGFNPSDTMHHDTHQMQQMQDQLLQQQMQQQMDQQMQQQQIFMPDQF
jgi:hypothetical protein